MATGHHAHIVVLKHGQGVKRFYTLSMFFSFCIIPSQCMICPEIGMPMTISARWYFLSVKSQPYYFFVNFPYILIHVMDIWIYAVLRGCNHKKHPRVFPMVLLLNCCKLTFLEVGSHINPLFVPVYRMQQFLLVLLYLWQQKLNHVTLLLRERFLHLSKHANGTSSSGPSGVEHVIVFYSLPLLS